MGLPFNNINRLHPLAATHRMIVPMLPGSLMLSHITVIGINPSVGVTRVPFGNFAMAEIK